MTKNPKTKQQQRDIRGDARTITELLDNKKFAIDYYQREFKWQTKQIDELIRDLVSKFLEDFDKNHERLAVKLYSHYFLGSIIISKKENKNYIIDGQQRLTSLTLLLIHLMHLAKKIGYNPVLESHIYSESYGEKTFNIDEDERKSAMKALFEGDIFDPTDQPESVQNLIYRYEDIRELFPDELTEDALPYFIDWLKTNVHIVEIITYSDDDAYTIFETMNDRGLSLSPTDMLKGYLLANISDSSLRLAASGHWKTRIGSLTELGKDEAPDFFKAWLRSQYAQSIRKRERGAVPEDFDRIGTEFHRWLREKKELVGLANSASYSDFIQKDFTFYSRQYEMLRGAAESLTDGYEHVFYNANHGFTLQYMLLLAPLTLQDDRDTIRKKVGIVARYIDIMLTRRLWNFRSVAYSTLQYTMFRTMQDIRRKDPTQLIEVLSKHLDKETEVFDSNKNLSVHQQNRKFIHRIIARITAYIDEQSGLSSRYVEYVTGTGSKKYEVEHIWADKSERHTDEFDHPHDFHQYRNKIGGLLLLPKSFNGSYGALPYKEKLPHYDSQNILARSLNANCYERNPGFTGFVNDSELPFRAHPEFKKSDMDARGNLYQQIAEQLWSPQILKRVD
ncbi:DUF262 domain-containing protein [Candidatus Neomarinimicrobiota bacterium]